MVLHPFRRAPLPRSPRTVLAALGVVAALSTAGFGIANADTAPTTPTALTDAVPAGGLGFSAPSAPAVPPPGPGSTGERRVLSLLNQQRALHDLPPLVWSSQLAQAALTHNSAMAAVDTLSHQLPGEADLGTRFTAAGYAWRAGAENIGSGTQPDDDGALRIQELFYDESPPNDGHRLNVLSTSYTQVGVSVLLDGRGKVWVTEDFGLPR